MNSGFYLSGSIEKKTSIKEIVEKNFNSYEHIAEEFAEKYFEADLSEESNRFRFFLPENATVIDLGCGVGRDLQLLALKGCNPTGLDISPAMLRVAKSRGISYPLIQGDMLDLPLRPKSFDGAWVCASLLHFPKFVIEPILWQIKSIVRTAVFISVIEGSGIRWSRETGGNSRYFSYYQRDEMTALLALSGFICEDVWIKKTGDSDINWLNLVATIK